MGRSGKIVAPRPDGLWRGPFGDGIGGGGIANPRSPLWNPRAPDIERAWIYADPYDNSNPANVFSVGGNTWSQIADRSPNGRHISVSSGSTPNVLAGFGENGNLYLPIPPDSTPVMRWIFSGFDFSDLFGNALLYVGPRTELNNSTEFEALWTPGSVPFSLLAKFRDNTGSFVNEVTMWSPSGNVFASVGPGDPVGAVTPADWTAYILSGDGGAVGGSETWRLLWIGQRSDQNGGAIECYAKLQTTVSATLDNTTPFGGSTVYNARDRFKGVRYVPKTTNGMGRGALWRFRKDWTDMTDELAAALAETHGLGVATESYLLAESTPITEV